jgi:hypothetical protein
MCRECIAESKAESQYIFCPLAAITSHYIKCSDRTFLMSSSSHPPLFSNPNPPILPSFPPSLAPLHSFLNCSLVTLLFSTALLSSLQAFVYLFNVFQIPNVAWQSYLQLSLDFKPWMLVSPCGVSVCVVCVVSECVVCGVCVWCID